MRIGSLLTLAPAAFLAVWFVMLRPTFLGGPAAYVMVSGVSMKPTLYSGDLVVTRAHATYIAGDIVAFHVPKGEPAAGAMIIHRIAAGNPDNGFVMQGDNKSAPDPWHPRESDIIGKLWVHLPGWSRWVFFLREPMNLGVLVGGVTTFSLLSGKQIRKRRRRGGRSMYGHGHSDRPSTNGGAPLPAPLWAIAGLGAALVGTLAFAFLAFRAFDTPATKKAFVERARYEQTASFEYTVQTQPATLYPEGVIGPVRPLPAVNGVASKVDVPPVYTKLAKSIDVGFRYRLTTSESGEFAGVYAVNLWIKAGDNGWTRAQELVPPTGFAGPEVTARVSIEFARMQGLIETVEKETGFTPGGYEISVVPTMRTKGTLAGEAIELTYAPAFTFKYTKTTITPDAQLTRSEGKSIGDTVSRRQNVSILGLGLPVSTARIVGVFGLSAGLALDALFAAVVFLGLGGDETAKVRARFGATMVRVNEADHNGNHVVQVASMLDLARLAARDGRIIFSQKLADGDLYFVPDGQTTYEYTATNGNGASAATSADAAPRSRARSNGGASRGQS